MTPSTDSHHHGSRQIDVQVFEEFESEISEDGLTHIASATLDVAGESAAGPLSIVIADDETVRALNKEHRGLDENTDVLSFSFEHQGEYYGDDHTEERDEAPEDFVLPPGGAPGLGEVIISYPQVVRQAGEAGRAVATELAHMLAHGILHLLGHDHMEPDEEAVMRDLENRVLSRVLPK